MNNNPNLSRGSSESLGRQDFLNDSDDIPPFNPTAALARREAVRQQEHLEQPEYRSLESLLPILNTEHSVIMGHGTASAGEQGATIHSIFQQGLKGYESLGSVVGEDRKNKVVGSTDLTQTAIGLYDTDTTSANLDFLRDKLNHWPHHNAKNIVLMRLPIEYFNIQTAFPEERNQPFFTQHPDNQGQMTNYLDRRFIIGNYNTDSGLVELNPYFIDRPDQAFQQEMAQRLAAAKQDTAERVARMEATPLFGHQKQSLAEVQPEAAPVESSEVAKPAETSPESPEAEENLEEQAEREWRLRRLESLAAAIEDQVKNTERRAEDANYELQRLQAIIEEELSLNDKADTGILRSYNQRYSDYNDELNLISRKLNELAEDLLATCSHGREDFEPERFEELRRRGFSLIEQSEDTKKSFRRNLDHYEDTSRRIRRLDQLAYGW